MCLISVCLLTACSIREVNKRISFNDLFISMVGNEYRFNLNLNGAEKISILFPGEEKQILDYLIIESADVVSNELFIFLEVKPGYKIDAKILINQYLINWGIEHSMENEISLENSMLFENDEILIYSVSEENERFRAIIQKAFK